MKSKNLKLYYSVNEVAQLLDEEPSTIYYWVKAYKLRLPESKHSSRLRFRNDEIEKLRQIKHLVRDKRLTSDGVKASMKQSHTDELTKRAEAMEHFRKALSQVELILDGIDRHRFEQQKRKLSSEPLLAKKAKSDLLSGMLFSNEELTDEDDTN